MSDCTATIRTALESAHGRIALSVPSCSRPCATKFPISRVVTATVLAVSTLSAACGGGVGLESDIVAAAEPSTRSAKLVQKSSLVYEGAFRVPQGSSETATFN